MTACHSVSHALHLVLGTAIAAADVPREDSFGAGFNAQIDTLVGNATLVQQIQHIERERP
jgi:hypothetical protein